MICGKPECTGVHDNNRYHELCPWAIFRKQDRDNKYYGSARGTRSRIASKYGVPLADLSSFLSSAVAEIRAAPRVWVVVGDDAE